MATGIQIDTFSGNHHFNEARAGNRFLLQAETGKEACKIPGTLQTHFLCSVILRLEEQKPKNQITEMLTAAGFDNADIPKTEGAVLPPDPAGCSRDTVQIYKGIPAGRIEVISAAAED